MVDLVKSSPVAGDFPDRWLRTVGAASAATGLARYLNQNLWERLQPRRFSHGLTAGIIFYRNGSLRCALFPVKKIPPGHRTGEPSDSAMSAGPADGMFCRTK